MSKIDTALNDINRKYENEINVTETISLSKDKLYSRIDEAENEIIISNTPNQKGLKFYKEHKLTNGNIATFLAQSAKGKNGYGWDLSFTAFSRNKTNTKKIDSITILKGIDSNIENIATLRKMFNYIRSCMSGLENEYTRTLVITLPPLFESHKYHFTGYQKVTLGFSKLNTKTKNYIKISNRTYYLRRDPELANILREHHIKASIKFNFDYRKEYNAITGVKN